MEFCFLETEIWYTWLGLDKNWVIIIQDEKKYPILCTNLWMTSKGSLYYKKLVL